MAVLSAERIKITTTKSPLWCTITIIVLGLGVAWMIGRSSSSSIQAYNDEAASGTPDFEKFLPTFNDAGLGVSGFGVMVLMIMAALAITSEYRFGIIRTTFQAIPSRSSVPDRQSLPDRGFRRGAVLRSHARRGIHHQSCGRL